ncbi:hypothetical protein NLI96_g859 [Meripilus lineatus]|uniref:Uncharacterized protein n=1 Tax=Meripilus lineatus TaxID=2056292 RepID=A0AAD5YLM2_9APHY|nr:hypothetical protein NLI96_g859 [Physisporinus lineatus]
MLNQIASTSSTSSEKLPTYEELRAERTLKETFGKLVVDHEEIQKLFVSVAGELESTQKIGESHPLYFSRVLVPLSRSKMTLQEKKFMINKFIEAIPVHQDAARKTASKFHELGKKVEVFPLKVSSYLREEADAGGFWWQLWTGVEDLCMSIWNALYGLLRAMVNTFRHMLSYIDAIHFYCGNILIHECTDPYLNNPTGPFLHVELEMSEPSLLAPEPPSAKDTMRNAKIECKEIANKLNGFEDAWHLVRLGCDNLLQTVTLAREVSSIPIAYNAHLDTAQMVYGPLVQCLLAYSTGKSPL